MPEAISASLRTSDLDRMWSFLDARYHRSRLRLTNAAQPLRAHVDVVELGPVTLGRSHFGAELEIVIPMIDTYHVNIPLSGRIRSRDDSREPLVIGAGNAMTYQPMSSIHDLAGAGCSLLNLKIDPAALQDQLADMLDAPVTAAPVLGPRVDVTRGAGLAWARLVRLLAADARQPGALIRHPMMRDRFLEMILGGLLLSTEHRYRDDLARGRRPTTSPRSVRRVMELVQAHPEMPFTLSGLAQVAGVSRRSLQTAFQRHVGTSPMGYLRDVRLAGAHRALREGGATTVAAVAHAWGFGHLGRFSALYRARYGVPPSATLRDRADAAGQ